MYTSTAREKVARPERLELPTLWFEGLFLPARGTTPGNEMQENKGKPLARVAPFCTVLSPVYGQKTDSG